jgi:hypothetical protein
MLLLQKLQAYCSEWCLENDVDVSGRGLVQGAITNSWVEKVSKNVTQKIRC